MNREELQAVISENEYVLLDFYATWCMPCKMQSQILADIDNAGYKLVKIDVDENEDLAREYQVVSVPTLLAYNNGNIAKRYVGVAKSEEIIAMVENDQFIPYYKSFIPFLFDQVNGRGLHRK